MILKGFLIVIVVVALFISVRYFQCVNKAEGRLDVYKKISSTIKTSYGNMNYIDRGEGETVLVCHGICGGYDQAYDVLKDREDDYRIIAPSRFGYLGSDMPKNATVKEQVKAYVELLDELGIEKTYVLGTSAGGSFAIRFALDFPERTKGLILYCSAMPSMKEPDEIPKYVGPPAQIAYNFPMWLISPLFEPLMGMDSSVINTILPINERHEGIVFDASVSNIDMDKNFNDYKVETLKVPTLVFNAKDDKLAKYSRTKDAVTRFPNCKFISFESGGHLMVGNEETINKELDKFINKNK